MHSTSTFSFLRRVLAVDAASSGALGLGALLLAPTLAEFFGLPVDLLREAGIVLLPFAAFVGFLASRREPSRIGVWIVIALNVLWVIDSILLLFANGIEPNALGYAFVIAQAVAVGVFAEIEYIGLRRATRMIAA